MSNKKKMNCSEYGGFFNMLSLDLGLFSSIYISSAIFLYALTITKFFFFMGIISTKNLT